LNSEDLCKLTQSRRHRDQLVFPDGFTPKHSNIINRVQTIAIRSQT